MFKPGRTYRRREIHDKYGGQRRGGISTPKNYPYIFLFTGYDAARFGYHDEWDADGSFIYTGEGQRGDMAFRRGNRAIRDHAKEGKDLLLFEQVGAGTVRFVGTFVCASVEETEGLDVNGRQRKVIRFRLVPLEHGHF